MCINVELSCDCIVKVVGSEHILTDGSRVSTKGNENVHCQSSKKDVIRTTGNEDFGKRASGGSEERLSVCRMKGSLVWILRCGNPPNNPRARGVREKGEGEFPWATWEQTKRKTGRVLGGPSGSIQFFSVRYFLPCDSVTIDSPNQDTLERKSGATNNYACVGIDGVHSHQSLVLW